MYSNGAVDIGSQKEASIQIKDLIKQKKYSEAKKICEEFEDNPVIQSQLVTILIGESSLDKAEKICRKFSDYAPLQSQLVRVLVKKGNIEEAKKICERFKEHAPLQAQLVRILMNQGDLDKALKVCDKFRNDRIIQTQLMPIITKQIKEREANKLKTIGEVFEKEIAQIRIRARENEGTYAEEMGKLDLISQRGNSDLRAKMQFLIYLRKYGMIDVVEKRLNSEDEIYQEIYRIVLFSRDNSSFSKNKLGRSKLIKDTKHMIMLNGGDEEYAKEVLNRAMGIGDFQL